VQLLTNEHHLFLEEDLKYIFRHQYFRDFLSAFYMRQILKKYKFTPDSGLPSVLSDRAFMPNIAKMLGECLGEHKNTHLLNHKTALHDAVDTMRELNSEETGYALYNVIKCWEGARQGKIIGEDLTRLNLTQVPMNGIRFSSGAKATCFDEAFLSNISLLSTGHGSSVISAVYSNNEQRVLSASYDKTIREWDRETRKCLRIFEGHTDAVHSAAYSADERRVLSASRDKTIREWDRETRKCLRIFEGHAGAVYHAIYSTNERYILSASKDKTIREWDRESRKCQREFKGHSFLLNSAVYSVDERRVLSASRDNTIWEWDRETEECMNSIQHHTGLYIKGCSFKNAKFRSPKLETVVLRYGGVLFRTHLECVHIKKLAHLCQPVINFPSEQHTHLIITGKNGSGKTALLDSIHKCLADFSEDSEKSEVSSPALILDFYGCGKKDFTIDFRQYLKRENMVYHYFPANNRLDDNRISNLSGFIKGLKLKADNISSSDHVYCEQVLKTFERRLKELFAIDTDVTFDFSVATNLFLREEKGKKHPFDRLPHGFKSLLGIFGKLNISVHEQGGLPETAKGLVLIDEPELHLHIAPQKMFMPNLIKMFPHIQFVIATHSPFILNSVNNAVVYDLENQVPLTGMTAYSYEDVVEHYFNNDKYSQDIKDKYKKYLELVEIETKSPGGKKESAELGELRHHFNNLRETGKAGELVLAFRIKELELKSKKYGKNK